MKKMVSKNEWKWSVPSRKKSCPRCNDSAHPNCKGKIQYYKYEDVYILKHFQPCRHGCVFERISRSVLCDAKSLVPFINGLLNNNPKISTRELVSFLLANKETKKFVYDSTYALKVCFYAKNNWMYKNIGPDDWKHFV